MTGNTNNSQYGTRGRVISGVLVIAIVLGNLYAISIERTFPDGFFGYIVVMALCSVLLVHIYGHVAVTGNRPGYLREQESKDAEDKEDK